MNENENDVNMYVPSLLHPRQIKKDISLTQSSQISRCALSLKRTRNRMTLNSDSLLNDKENVPPGDVNRSNKTNNQQILGPVKCASKEKEAHVRKMVLISPPPLKRKNTDCNFSVNTYEKHFGYENKNNTQRIPAYHDFNLENLSAGYVNKQIDTDSSLFSFGSENDTVLPINKPKGKSHKNVTIHQNLGKKINYDINNGTNVDSNACCENFNKHNNISSGRSEISLLLTVKSCQNVKIDTQTCDLKTIQISQCANETEIYCNILESIELSSCQSTTCQEDQHSENDDLDTTLTMYVNIEVKKEKLWSETEKEKNSKVNKILILNTNAIKNISNVIVQPPNYKLLKRQISDKSKFKRRRVTVLGISKKNDQVNDKWKQKSILDYLNKHSDCVDVSSQSDNILLFENYIDKRLNFKNGKSFLNQSTFVEGYGQEMSKNLSLVESSQAELKTGKSKSQNNEQLSKSKSPTFKSAKSPKKQNLKVSSVIASRSSRPKSSSEAVPNYCSSAPLRGTGSPDLDSAKSKIKKPKSPISIPYYKIIAGTHFAVDAFCYGNIPHVQNYFLTHFHADHYSGLNKNFSKTVFCSKITAELCVTRLGVNPKCISIINPDETIVVDGVEITAVDANHCPGAIMLVFTLLNGKTILHTGDFRATPAMESYPIFWNKDIHTVYLDTTYCNPRYDFPTQDQSLDMALYLLRQKKQEVEKAGSSFSSVLIVCGTYTIGKEKFLLGISRRVGCTVWVCSEKAAVLSALEGHPFNVSPPQNCQLHALPMKDLTYEKLKAYLESFKGTFNELVAFKPSGWENEKNSTIEKDKVTIYGIPYSEHSSFSEMVRFIKYLKPKLVVPTVDICGGVKTVQKYFPCPLVYKEDDSHQTRVTDYFRIQRQQVPAVT